MGPEGGLFSLGEKSVIVHSILFWHFTISLSLCVISISFHHDSFDMFLQYVIYKLYIVTAYYSMFCAICYSVFLSLFCIISSKHILHQLLWPSSAGLSCLLTAFVSRISALFCVALLQFLKGCCICVQYMVLKVLSKFPSKIGSR